MKEKAVNRILGLFVIAINVIMLLFVVHCYKTYDNEVVWITMLGGMLILDNLFMILKDDYN